MADRTLADEIISIVQSEANNNPAPVEATINKVYTDGHCDVTTNTGRVNYVKVIGDPAVNNTGVIIYPDGNTQNPVLITKSTTGGGSIISVGSFTINSSGHLIVTLPNGVDNPYYINNQGHLIYDTANTHNGGT